MDAADLIGKHVLIGITYLDPAGNVLERSQMHGDIIDVSAEVITVRLAGSGEEFTLPPDVSAFEPAPAGIYRLHATGEQVENPDLLTTWTVHMAPPNADAGPET